ncbi:MAG: DUF559 domain-containing protein [Candidatus Aminicenantia bacterium]
MEKILKEMEVEVLWSIYLRVGEYYKFPDFTIKKHKPMILIEVDGLGVHNKKDDINKDKLYLKSGYSILRFSDREVTKNPDLVKLVIRKALSTSKQVWRTYWLSGKLEFV